MRAKFQQNGLRIQFLVVVPLADENVLDQSGIHFIRRGLEFLGKFAVGRGVGVGAPHQQAHLAHLFAVHLGFVFFRIGDTVAVDVDEHIGVALQQLFRRAARAAVGARVVREEGVLRVFHGNAQRLQVFLQGFAHVEDARVFFQAGRSIGGFIGFVAVGGIHGDALFAIAIRAFRR